MVFDEIRANLIALINSYWQQITIEVVEKAGKDKRFTPNTAKIHFQMNGTRNCLLNIA